MEHTRHALVILILLGAILLGATSVEARTTRHHRHGGTVVRISDSSITIHSKSQNTNWTFVIDGSTSFLSHGQPIARTRIRLGSYVSISYSSLNGRWVAWHISLRSA